MLLPVDVDAADESVCEEPLDQPLALPSVAPQLLPVDWPTPVAWLSVCAPESVCETLSVCAPESVCDWLSV